MAPCRTTKAGENSINFLDAMRGELQGLWFVQRRAIISAHAMHSIRPAKSGSDRAAWAVTLAAAAILMVTMGARQSLGLFIAPLKGATGLGIGTISLALAIAQLLWGAVQPIAGAVADRYGPSKVLIAGLLLLAIGMALTPLMTSGLGLVVSLGLLSAVGAGAGSFSVLIGAASQRLTAENRGKSAGIINAGGSLGQFVFAPLAQALIQMLGWVGAMWVAGAGLRGRAAPGAHHESGSSRTARRKQHRLLAMESCVGCR
jgi:MFS family permease